MGKAEWPWGVRSDAMAGEHDTARILTIVVVRDDLEKRLRLVLSIDSPAEAPVVVANREAFERALASATGQPTEAE